MVNPVSAFISLLSLFMMVASLQAERSFFPLDNAFKTIKDPNEQAALLKELGYDGIGSRPKHLNDKLLAAMDEHGLNVYASYVVVGLKEEDASVPYGVIKHLEKLKGGDTIIWLSLTNRRASDESAVAMLHQISDLARENDLRVVLYPHAGFKTATVEDCLRLLKKANRPELGLSFTLCHFLKLQPYTELEATIREIAPYLELVQINGANRESTGAEGWKDFIKPLGEGNFDMEQFLSLLDEIGYDGPVNLQCYDLSQPESEHLAASIAAWNAYHEE